MLKYKMLTDFDSEIDSISLQDKVILITGASRGIGRAIAKAYATAGARLILLARSIPELKSLHDEIKAESQHAPILHGFNLASASAEDYNDMRRHIDQHFGRLDGIVHQAGILGDLTPLEQFDIQTWYTVLQVNLNAPFLLTQALLPLLKRSKDASILFTLHPIHQYPKAYWGAFGVASAGLHALIQTLHDELEHTSIRVNAIQPPPCRTPFRAKAYPGETGSELMEPAEITDAYVQLMASSGVKFQGQVIQIPLEKAMA